MSLVCFDVRTAEETVGNTVEEERRKERKGGEKQCMFMCP